MFYTKLSLILLVSLIVLSKIEMNPIDEESSHSNTNNKNGIADTLANAYEPFDEKLRNLKLLIGEQDSSEDVSSVVDDEELDNQEVKYIIKKSAPRRIFIGKRYNADDLERPVKYQNYFQGKRNGNIHRIFIGKRGDIKRIFIG
jgi:hypothetical protein